MAIMTKNINDDFDDEEKSQIALSNVANDLVPKDFAKKFKALKKAQDELAEIESQVKNALLQMFESIPDLKANTVTIDGIKFTYVKTSTRKTIDSKKLQEEMPEIYNKFLKTTKVSSSLRISVDY